MLKLFIGRWRNQTMLRTLDAIFMCFLLTALFASAFVVLVAYIGSLLNEGDHFFIGFIFFTVFIPLVIIFFSISGGYTLRRNFNSDSAYSDERLRKTFEPIKMLLGLKADGNNVYSYNRTLFKDDINSIVETAAIKAGLKDVPYVFTVNSFIPTVFSCGHNVKYSAIFITTKLLDILNREELEAVVLQQIGLIVSGETNCFYYQSHFVVLLMCFARDLFRESFVDRIEEDNFLDDYLLFALLVKKKGSFSPFFLIISVLSLIVPFIMTVFYYFLPKKRMYYADAFSAFVSKNPHALACALAKIDKMIRQPHFKKDLSSMCIENLDPTMFLNDDTLMCKDPLLNSALIVPIMKQMEASYGDRMFEPLKTHPSVKERVDILNLVQTGSFAEYNRAYKRVTRKCGNILP